MESLRLFTSHSVLCEQVAQCFCVTNETEACFQSSRFWDSKKLAAIFSFFSQAKYAWITRCSGKPNAFNCNRKHFDQHRDTTAQCSFKHRTEQYPYAPTIPSPLRQGAPQYKITPCIIQAAKVHSVRRVTDSMSGFDFQVDGLYVSATTLSSKTSYTN